MDGRDQKRATCLGIRSAPRNINLQHGGASLQKPRVTSLFLSHRAQIGVMPVPKGRIVAALPASDRRDSSPGDCGHALFGQEIRSGEGIIVGLDAQRNHRVGKDTFDINPAKTFYRHYWDNLQIEDQPRGGGLGVRPATSGGMFGVPGWDACERAPAPAARVKSFGRLGNFATFDTL
jgi:hypothetical protein